MGRLHTICEAGAICVEVLEESVGAAGNDEHQAAWLVQQPFGSLFRPRFWQGRSQRLPPSVLTLWRPKAERVAHVLIAKAVGLREGRERLLIRHEMHHTFGAHDLPRGRQGHFPFVTTLSVRCTRVLYYYETGGGQAAALNAESRTGLKCALNEPPG